MKLHLATAEKRSRHLAEAVAHLMGANFTDPDFSFTVEDTGDLFVGLYLVAPDGRLPANGRRSAPSLRAFADGAMQVAKMAHRITRS